MKIVVIGAAGAIGKVVVPVLLARGHHVRVVGRDVGKIPDFGEVERVSADIATEDGCARALAGMDAAIYTLGLPYTKKAFATYGPMMERFVAAAKRAGVKTALLISNVYPYGRPRTPLVAEDHPRVSVSVKGLHRKAQEDALLAADGPGLRAISLRLPNFYGPDATASLAHGIFEAARTGGTANLLGPIDTPQEMVFTPDVGPVIADLLEHPEARGAYNFAGPGHTTFREFTAKVFAAAGKPVKSRVAGRGMVRVMGLFSSLLRELGEMMYLQETPVLLDDTKLRAFLPGLRKTSYDEGIRLTLAARPPTG